MKVTSKNILAYNRFCWIITHQLSDQKCLANSVTIPITQDHYPEGDVFIKNIFLICDRYLAL